MMKSGRVIFVIGLLFLSLNFAGIGLCQDREGAFTLSPFIGGHLFEGDQNLEHKPTYGLGFGYNLDKNWGLEAVFNYGDTEFDKGGGDVDTYLYRLDALYHFMPDRALVPYLATGIGGITFDPGDDGDSDSDFIANTGGGIKYFLNDNIALRGDARYLVSFNDTRNNLIYTVGLTYLFGGKKQKEYKDTDGDGVYDYLDKCPGTPAGVKVDTSGCPLDTDGDGVYDYLDKCPDTPKGVKVDTSGCPLDTDGDGVYDYLDKCPGTPVGAKVDARGCWTLTGVLFETAKWDINSQAFQKLGEVIEVMKKNPSLKLEVQGYTDNRGAAAFNMKLSEKRANAIMEYFIDNGIESGRISAKGFGLSNPATTNDTPEGRAINRRVELKPIY